MGTPYVGEIRAFAMDYAPRGWALCNGQTLQITGQTAALYAVLGNQYGGDGQTTFALPDLRGLTPVGAQDHAQPGTISGTDSVELNQAQLPPHTHQLQSSPNLAESRTPTNCLPAAPAAGSIYGTRTDIVVGTLVGPNDGGQPYDSMQPYLPINYCIALQGLYPPKPTQEEQQHV